MSDGLIKSAGRVFDVLELFRERQCPLRLKDVVDALGMPASSAAALLKTIAQKNYLSFESSSHAYLSTPKLSQLGEWVTPASARSPVPWRSACCARRCRCRRRVCAGDYGGSGGHAKARQ